MSWADVSEQRRRTAERILTPRQLDVVTRRIDGLSFRQIALDLNLDQTTVREHWTKALDRLRKDAPK